MAELKLRSGTAIGLLAAFCIGAAPAFAQNDGLQRCSVIPDDAARLACFDELSRATQSTPAAPQNPSRAPMKESAARTDETPSQAASAPVPAPASKPTQDPLPAPAKTASSSEAPAPVTEPGTQPKAEFGFSEAQLRQRDPDAEKPLDEITAVVASAKRFGPGYWRLTFTNGAVWQTTETRTSFRPPRNGDTVVVRRASLGSYLLEVDQQWAMRIKRVK